MPRSLEAHGPTHYDTLAVPWGAPSDVVRKAYRKQAQQNHPDRAPGDVQAQQRMVRINQAYEVLSDPARRATYDRWVEARELRIAAERAAGQAAQSASVTPAWPWYLLAATLAFALLSIATVVYKAVVPSVAAPAKKPLVLEPSLRISVTQAASR